MPYRNKAQNGFFRRNRQLGAAIDARVGSLSEKFIIDHIWDQTLSQAGSPVWRHFSDEELMDVCRGATRQTVHNALDRLMSDEFGWISRRPAAHDRRAWEYRVHTENFVRGPLWAAREKCRPRADAKGPDMQSGLGITPDGLTADMPSALDILSPAELASPTWHNLSADCTYACECPYLLKKFKNSLSSSSFSATEPTTTGSATDVASPDAAPDCPTSSEQRIADDPPDRRDAVSAASVRPVDRTERKRALPRPPQRRAKNGGDRPDGGSRQTACSRTVEQNSTVLRDPVHCPPVVAEAVRDTLGTADQSILGQIWHACARAAPGITAAEVAQLVRRNARKVRPGVDLPHKYLLTCMVTDLRGSDVLKDIRRDLAVMDAARAEQEQRAEYARMEAEAYIRKCQDESS